jgi:hypothetical protein
MKPSVKQIIIAYTAAAMGLLGVFYKPAGLPEWSPFILFGLSAVGAWYVVWLQRRAKKCAGRIANSASPRQTRKYTWLQIGVVLVACAISPFIMPYTGVRLPLAEEIVTSIVTFIVCICIILFVRRYRGKGLTNR